MYDFELLKNIIISNRNLFGNMVTMGDGECGICVKIEASLISVSLTYDSINENRHLTIYVGFNDIDVYVSYHGDNIRHGIRNTIIRQYNLINLLSS